MEGAELIGHSHLCEGYWISQFGGKILERQLRSVESERLAIEREYLYWLYENTHPWERSRSGKCGNGFSPLNRIYNIEENN